LQYPETKNLIRVYIIKGPRADLLTRNLVLLLDLHAPHPGIIKRWQTNEGAIHKRVLSTPVIDRHIGVLYACAWISPDHSGRWQTGEHFAAALDLVTGALVKPLLSLEGADYDPGHSLPVQHFRSKAWSASSAPHWRLRAVR
jgi:hypothetical protein